MKETRYLISETAKLVQVEPHVLRYWEEELGLSIKRNEMGHRYYTDKDLEIFQKIKELKKDYPQANIAAVDYDPGASEVNQLNRIKLMLSVAKENMKNAK